MENKENNVIQKAIEEFNSYRAPECVAELSRTENFRIVVSFRGPTASFACCYDEHIIDFLDYLSKHTGRQYDLTRLYRPTQDCFVAVFVSDSDRPREVVDFGFPPFDLIL